MKTCCSHRKPALDTGILPSKEMGEYEGQPRRSRSESISENRRSRSPSRGRLDRSQSRGRLDRSSSIGRLDRSSSRGRNEPSAKRRPERSETKGTLGPLREERENSQSRLMKSTFSSRSKSRDKSLYSGFQPQPRNFSGSQTLPRNLGKKSQTLPRNLGKERKSTGGYGGYNYSNDRHVQSNSLPRRDSRGKSPPKGVSKTWILPSPPQGASFTSSARPKRSPDTLPSYTSRPSSSVSPTESLSFPKTLPFGANSKFGSAPTISTTPYAPFRSSKTPDRTYRRSPTPDRHIPTQMQGKSLSREKGIGRSNASYSNKNNTQTTFSSSKFSALSSSSYAQKSSSMLQSSSFKENEGYKSSSHLAKSSGARKGLTKIGLSGLRIPTIEDPVDKPEALGINNRVGSNSSMWTGTKHVSSVSHSMSRKSSYSSHVM